jgi:hypothetical protein
MSSRQIKYVPQKNVPSVLFSIRITTALGTFFRGTDVNSRFLRLILEKFHILMLKFQYLQDNLISRICLIFVKTQNCNVSSESRNSNKNIKNIICNHNSQKITFFKILLKRNTALCQVGWF